MIQTNKLFKTQYPADLRVQGSTTFFNPKIYSLHSFSSLPLTEGPLKGYEKDLLLFDTLPFLSILTIKNT